MYLTKIRIGKKNRTVMKMIVTLYDLTDETLRFIRQIGVEHVKIDVLQVPGRRETGRLSEDSFREVVRKIADAGLQLEFMGYSPGLKMANILAGEITSEESIAALKVDLEFLAGMGVSMLEVDNGMHNFDKVSPQPCSMLGFYEKEGRGGASMKCFDLEEARKSPQYHTKLGRVGKERVWPLMRELYAEVIFFAESLKVKILYEGDDPPIRDYRGLYRPLITMDDIEEILDEVPSPYHGITYCVGARLEAGEDVLAGIRRFGGRGKIFHIHFRNVRGTVPAWEECFLDEGDLSMWAVLKTLKDVGYTGYIAPPSFAHNPRVLNTSFPDRLSMAWAVGYTKAMLQAVDQEGP